MSDETPGPRAYPADAITVTYDASVCFHAAECVRGLPEVFHPEVRPWITPQAATPERVAEVVGRCPSGALGVTLGPRPPQ
jgi:uncharacterized Fe-S cluster protein YjdI